MTIYYKYLLEYLIMIQKPITLAVLPYSCYFHLKHCFKTLENKILCSILPRLLHFKF